MRSVAHSALAKYYASTLCHKYNIDVEARVEKLEIVSMDYMFS